MIVSATRPGPSAYDPEGRRHVFVPAPGDARRYALDIERRGAEVSVDLCRALGASDAEDALRLWVALEVEAKLRDVPAHLLLARGGRDTGIELRRCDTADFRMAVGRHAAEGGSAGRSGAARAAGIATGTASEIL